MKTGVIVYVTGDSPSDWTESNEDDKRLFAPRADMVKVITRTTGHFDLHDAYFELISRGMSFIVCKLAEFNESGQIHLTGRELRLCG